MSSLTLLPPQIQVIPTHDDHHVGVFGGGQGLHLIRPQAQTFHGLFQGHRRPDGGLNQRLGIVKPVRVSDRRDADARTLEPPGGPIRRIGYTTTIEDFDEPVEGGGTPARGSPKGAFVAKLK